MSGTRFFVCAVNAVTLILAAPVLAVQTFSPIPISINTGSNHFPKTDGRYVVWANTAPRPDNDSFGFDLLTHTPFVVADGPLYQDSPAIHNGTVIWNHWIPGSDFVDIRGRHLPGAAAFTVTEAPAHRSAQAINGDVVVWHDNREGTFSIFGRRLSEPAGSDFRISPVTAYEQTFPDVSGDTAVWMSFQEPGDQGNIYGRNLTTGVTFPITTHPAYQLFPAISGDHVVWQDWRNGRPRIYARNLLTNEEFPISADSLSQSFDQSEPAIDGSVVVWMDTRNGSWDVWARDLRGGPEYPVTSTLNQDEMWPDISGNVVVWQTSVTSTRNDIYGTVIPEPTALAAAGLLIAPLALRRRALQRA